MSDTEEPDFDPADIDDEPEVEEVRVIQPKTPTIDDESPPAVSYQDWSKEGTQVVSGPIGPVKNYPGTRFRSRREARKFWTAKAGRIIEDMSISGRWIFRVKKAVAA